MKKILELVFVFFMCFTLLFSVEAQAYETSDRQEQALILSQSEIDEILAKGNSYTANERASGLIYMVRVAINDDYVMLQFVGDISCASTVVKCGFEDIIVQRRASSSSSWQKYHQFDDDISEATNHLTIKAVTTNPGYEYRVKCTAYAKKNILSVQKEVLYTNIIAW